MQLHITHLNRFKTDKDKKPLINKNGKPYTRLVIRCQEYGDKMISGFDSPQTQNWKEGDTVEAVVTENGQYLNLKVPTQTDALEERVKRLEEKVFGEEPF